MDLGAPITSDTVAQLAPKQLSEHLAPLADYAGDRHRSEAPNRCETSVLNTVEQILDAVDGLPDNVGIMLDSYHMNIEEADPCAAIVHAAPRLVHVQVSGSHRGAPGDDHLDWDRWMNTLIGTGYRRAVCLESCICDNEAIAVAAVTWRPPAAVQDDLAREGLAHLRYVLGAAA